MWLLRGNGEWLNGPPVIDGVFRPAQGQIDQDLTAALWAFHLQSSAAFAELVGDDPPTCATSDGDFRGFIPGLGREHSGHLLSAPWLPLPADSVPTAQAAPCDRQGRFWTLADFGNVEKAKVNHKATWDLTIINAGDMSTQSKTIIQNVPIAIEH